MLGKWPIEWCYLADGSQSQQAHASDRWRFGPTPAIEDLQGRARPLANQPICDARCHQFIAELAIRQWRLACPLHQSIDFLGAQLLDEVLPHDDEHCIQHGRSRPTTEFAEELVLFRRWQSIELVLGPPALDLEAQELAPKCGSSAFSMTCWDRAMDRNAIPGIAGAQLELPNQAGQVVGGWKRGDRSH